MATLLQTLDPRRVFEGNNGDDTKALYALLDGLGPHGMLCTALFRAQKRSERAKQYQKARGARRYAGAAYDVKQWSLQEVCRIMALHPEALQLPYGWKQDHTTRFGERSSWVLYVDTPHGQASFHAPSRCYGPEYVGEWVKGEGSREAILRYCECVLREAFRAQD